MTITGNVTQQVGDKVYTLTSEQKKVSVFEIQEKNQPDTGVRMKWVCDLKDAFRNVNWKSERLYK